MHYRHVREQLWVIHKLYQQTSQISQYWNRLMKWFQSPVCNFTLLSSWSVLYWLVKMTTTVQQIFFLSFLLCRNSNSSGMLQNARNKTKQSAIIRAIPVLLLLTTLMFKADLARFKNYIGLPTNKWAILIKEQKQNREKKCLSVTYSFLRAPFFCLKRTQC